MCCLIVMNRPNQEATNLQLKLNATEYKTNKLVMDVQGIQSSMDFLIQKLDLLLNRLDRRAFFLKRVLLSRVSEKLIILQNDYIATLYRKYNHSNGNPELDLTKDMTPIWQIADAILAETDYNTKTELSELFRFVYDIAPGDYFPDPMA